MQYMCCILFGWTLSPRHTTSKSKRYFKQGNPRSIFREIQLVFKNMMEKIFTMQKFFWCVFMFYHHFTISLGRRYKNHWHFSCFWEAASMLPSRRPCRGVQVCSDPKNSEEDGGGHESGEIPSLVKLARTRPSHEFFTPKCSLVREIPGYFREI